METALQVARAGGGAPELAARGLEHGAGRRQDDVVRRDARDIHRRGLDALPHPVTGRPVLLAGLGDHHQPLGPVGPGGRKDRDAAAPYAGKVADGGFQLVRMDVAAAADDDVLDPARQIDLAPGDVGQVAGLEPVAVEQVACRLRVLVIADGRRGTVELQAPLAALGHFAAGIVDHPELMPGERRTARHDLDRVFVPGRHRHRTRPLDQLGPVDPIGEQPPAGPGKGQPHAALGKAVDRGERPGIEAVGREALAERPDGRGPHRLRPVDDHTGRAEVEALDRAVVDPPDAQVEGEVGRTRKRPPPGVDLPQPALRARQEDEGRHDRHRHRKMEAAEPRADQAHVVVERKPAHEHVAVGLDFHGPAHGTNVGQQIGVAQHHALRIAGAARGVLKKGDVCCVACRGGCRSAAPKESLDGLDGPKARDLRAQEGREHARLRHGDQNLGSRVGEDHGLPAQVIRELRRPRRRIDRNRHASGVEDPEEGLQKPGAGGQHQRDAGARCRARIQDAARDGESRLAEPRVGDGLEMVFPFPEPGVDAVGMRLGVPVEHLSEGRRGTRYRFNRALGGVRQGRRGRACVAPAGRFHRAPEIGRGFGFRQR